MSTFECPVVRVKIEPHPNADAIEIAQIAGYQSIVKKGQFKDGDLAVYIPEQSVLPPWLLKHLGFWDQLNDKGGLSGSAGNRVRAIKLRGVLSQGLLLGGHNMDCMLLLAVPFVPDADVFNPDVDTSRLRRFQLGQDLAADLGIVKYTPAVPLHMQGRVAGGDLDATIAYDIENLKKFPDLFRDGMYVTITEKIHGTLLQVGVIPRRLWEGKPWAEKCPDIGTRGFKGIVTSKGQGAKGLMLDPSDVDNLYVSVVREQGLWESLERMRTESLGHPDDMPLFLLGEIFGARPTPGGLKGVQDLTYGQNQLLFRAFEVYAGMRSNGFFLNDYLLDRCLVDNDIPRVPTLYRGPYSAEVVTLATNGMSTLTPPGAAPQIREGVVIRSMDEIPHPRYGRRIAKSTSEAYLLRKGEVTEYQ